MKDEKGAMKSILRAVRILESFDIQEGMTVTEISKKLSLPKSSVHDILSTFVKAGVLEKDNDNTKYYLGLKLFELGNKARSSLEIQKVATPFLKSLNGEFDETVHLTVLDKGEVLYIECFESSKRLRTYSVIGVRAPLHCTGVGKAMMAFLPKEEIKEIIQKKGLEKFTENTIVDREELLKELDGIRKVGYAIDNMEHEEYVRCVSAPIFNHEGRPFASISVSGPSQRFDSKSIPAMAKMVVSAAKDISRKMRYKENNSEQTQKENGCTIIFND